MVIELSGNYSVAIPVMVSSLIAYFISRRFPSSILSHSFGISAARAGTAT
jgi:H+/Cl- antiporter ClcA